MKKALAQIAMRERWAEKIIPSKMMRWVKRETEKIASFFISSKMSIASQWWKCVEQKLTSERKRERLSEWRVIVMIKQIDDEPCGGQRDTHSCLFTFLYAQANCTTICTLNRSTLNKCTNTCVRRTTWHFLLSVSVRNVLVSSLGRKYRDQLNLYGLI